jgi:[ribosomal protein S18]-alanine N-acetyltransferase
MPDLTLKPMSEHLLASAVELDQVCFGGFWNLAGYKQEFERETSTLLSLTKLGPAIADMTQPPELLIGISCGWRILEEMHITLLAVHPDYRRWGLGQILLNGLLWVGCQQNLERVTLEVRESNQAALALYNKFGFQVAGRRRRYYPDTGEDGLILWCGRLNEPEFGQMLRQQQQQIVANLQTRGWQLQIAAELNQSIKPSYC